MQKQRNRKLLLVISISLLLIAFLGCATSTAPVNKAPETAEWMFDDIVDAAFVKAHISIPMSDDVMLIDARPFKPKFVKGHIPMAVNIPHSKFDQMADKLPQNKDALLIYYCGGTKCKLSHKSAYKAEALGYTNVKVFAEGFPGWLAVEGNYPAVSVEWVKAQVDAQADMVVVDSRPKRKKYDKGHISTAISIPDMNFDKMTAQLPQDKEKTLVFYCGGFKCKLSHKSAQKAMALGYRNVKVFAAGYPAWIGYAGGATSGAMAKGAAVSQVKPGKEEGSIDIEYFKKVVSTNPEQFFLIDVRDPDEFSTGSLKTAKNIPVDNLEKQIKDLPSDRTIVFICGTGARSGESFYMVQDLRPEMKNVFYLDAEMTIKKDGSFTISKPAG
jgi:rhodanese-related sulfurtransferase